MTQPCLRLREVIELTQGGRKVNFSLEKAPVVNTKGKEAIDKDQKAIGMNEQVKATIG